MFLRSKSVQLLIGAAVMAASASAINTIPQWNGATFISSFGVTNTATYGETVIALGTGVIQDFAFEVGNCTAAVNFRGEIYAWDGTKATGASLFESPIFTVNPSSSYQLVTFSTGNLQLTPGQAYVLFASTAKDQTGAPSSSCRWGSVGNNTANPNGQFVFLNNGPDPTQWTITTWSNIAQDLAFSATFVGEPLTPAPSTLLLVVSGLIALGLFQFYRSRRPARVPVDLN